MNGSKLRPLCEAGHVLIVVAYYLPRPSGMTVTMHNLLSQFDPSSYSVVTMGGLTLRGLEEENLSQTYAILSSLERVSTRLDRWWQERQIPSAVSKLVRLIERVEPRVIVGVYPTFHFLKITREAAKATQVPWIAYLHDTVAEGLSATRWGDRALRLQEQVFGEAAAVLLMSRGMADLYERKYGMRCAPLEHTYPEAIPDTLPAPVPLRQAFWGGAVYNINDRAVARVSNALGAIQCSFLLTTAAKPEELEGQGVVGEHVKTTFYPTRAQYLEALQQQGFLVLALNWPDESHQHSDELATIFPTKTPEYLAAGRPILVHCPEDTFLARFFCEHQCGLVVSERSPAALERASRFLLEDSASVEQMRNAALATARHFSPARISERFQSVIAAAAQVNGVA